MLSQHRVKELSGMVVAVSDGVFAAVGKFLEIKQLNVHSTSSGGMVYIPGSHIAVRFDMERVCAISQLHNLRYPNQEEFGGRQGYSHVPLLILKDDMVWPDLSAVMLTVQEFIDTHGSEFDRWKVIENSTDPVNALEEAAQEVYDCLVNMRDEINRAFVDFIGHEANLHRGGTSSRLFRSLTEELLIVKMFRRMEEQGAGVVMDLMQSGKFKPSHQNRVGEKGLTRKELRRMWSKDGYQLLHPSDACPDCGESRMDYVMLDDMDMSDAYCISCGREYRVDIEC